MQDTTEIIKDIRLNESEIQQKKDRIKILQDDLKEEIDNTDAGQTVGRLKDQLKIAQEDLLSELKRNSSINDLMEEIAAEKEVLKGLQFALSNNLVAYFAQTQERQVQMDEHGHARDVLLSAKLGKDQHLYQESIFNTDAAGTIQPEVKK